MQHIRKILPMQQTECKVNSLIKDSGLPPIVQSEFKSHSSKPFRIYGLPKIHKARVPLRPVVNTIGAPTYVLAQFLARSSLSFVGKCPGPALALILILWLY